MAGRADANENLGAPIGAGAYFARGAPRSRAAVEGAKVATRARERSMTRRILAALGLVAALTAVASAEEQRAAHTRGLSPRACLPQTTKCSKAQLESDPRGGNGPMIDNVKVFLVFYSPAYPYMDQLVSFYTAIVQSAYVDMLMEYDKASYQIRRGSYLGLLEDSNPNPASVRAIDPQTYLSDLIASGKVPQPDANTLYMIYFPSHIDPTAPLGGNSCITGGAYCAYHSYFKSGDAPVYFGVIPDTPDQCTPGCGPSGFDGLTDVSGHELAEALTDPEPNLSWTDVNNTGCGEIGDICADIAHYTCTQEWDLVTGYAVQKEWSNELNGCIVANPKYTADLTSPPDLATGALGDRGGSSDGGVSHRNRAPPGGFCTVGGAAGSRSTLMLILVCAVALVARRRVAAPPIGKPSVAMLELTRANASQGRGHRCRLRRDRDGGAPAGARLPGHPHRQA
jgi:hypothetical protein